MLNQMLRRMSFDLIFCANCIVSTDIRSFFSHSPFVLCWQNIVIYSQRYMSNTTIFSRKWHHLCVVFLVANFCFTNIIAIFFATLWTFLLTNCLIKCNVQITQEIWFATVFGMAIKINDIIDKETEIRIFFTWKWK